MPLAFMRASCLQAYLYALLALAHQAQAASPVAARALPAPVARPVVYNVSSLSQFKAALKKVARHANYSAAHNQDVTISVLTSINMTARLNIINPVIISGVLQPDGSRPVLDCGFRRIHALHITAGGVTVAGLEITHCHNSAIVVLAAAGGSSYAFTNLLIRQNLALSFQAGGIFLGPYPTSLSAVLTGCEFVDNGVPAAVLLAQPKLALSTVPVIFNPKLAVASALVASWGRYTLMNCSFISNGAYGGGSSAAVVHFYATCPLASSTKDVCGATTSKHLSVYTKHLTFVNNSADFSTGVALFTVSQARRSRSDSCALTMSDSLLANNSDTTILGMYLVPPSTSVPTDGALGCSLLMSRATVEDNNSGDDLWLLSFTNQAGVQMNNVAVLDNTGAMGFMHLVRVDSVNFINSIFTNNTMKKQGLLLDLHSASDVYIGSCTFANNTVLNAGPTAGGAALAVITVVRSLQVFKTNFTNNGPTTFGGAVYITANMQANVFVDCTFAGNVAAFGGGALLYQTQGFTAPAKFLRCIFKANVAAYGGAVVLTRAGHVRFHNCSFTENVAGSGGAVVVSNNFDQHLFRDCTFLLNRATTTLTINDDVLWANACGPGGGGALCSVGAGLNGVRSAEQPRVTLRGSVLSNNTAVFGGAVYVGAGTDCALLQLSDPDEACYPLDLLYCELDGNTAAGGAGGALYVESQGILNNLCSDEQGGWVEELALIGSSLNASMWLNLTAFDDYLKNGDYPSEVSFRQLPCRSWSDNRAINSAYGPLVATPALNVTLLPPLAPSSILSLDLIPVLIQVTDWYNQAVSGVVAVASLPVAATSGVINAVGFGELGIINMSNLRLRAIPGVHNLTITVSQTLPRAALLATLGIAFAVEECPANYVTTADNSQCIQCAAGLYNIIPHAQTCLPCPTNAICSDANIGGGVLVPIPGFWHSHPFSAEVHACDNAVACTALGRTTSLAVMQEQYLDALFMGANSTTTAALLDLYLSGLCSNEYQGGGVLCGECSNGLGHVGVSCKACLPRNTVIAIHAVLTLVTLLFIALTIRSSLATARWHRPGVLDTPSHHLNNAPNALPEERPSLRASHRQRISHNIRSSGVFPVLSKDAWPLNEVFQHANAPCRDAQSSQVALLNTSTSGADRAPVMMDKGLPAVEGAGASVCRIVELGDSCNGDSGAAVSCKCQGQHATHASNTGGAPLSAKEEEVEGEEPQHMTIILILVSYLQVLAMPRRIALLWPHLLIHLLDIVSLATSASSSLAPFECFVHQGQRIAQVIQIRMIILLEPVIMMTIASIFWLARVAYKQNIRDLKISAAWYLKPRLILSACVVVFFVYPSVTDVIIGTFACQPVDTTTGVQLITDHGYDPLPRCSRALWAASGARSSTRCATLASTSFNSG